MPARTWVPPTVGDAVEVWLAHHDRVSPGLIEGLYLIGSVALDDWQTSSDIDIAAFTAQAPTDADLAAMNTAHSAATAELDGMKIDGPRLSWTDVQQPPAPLTRPWTLDGDFHHDDGCFELNPVTWFTLATYGVAVRGPDPADLDIALDRNDLATFILHNTDTYWRAVAESVIAAAHDPERETFSADVTTWCVLGVARMLYTSQTGDVVSKSSAGTWLATQLPQYNGLIEHALEVRQSRTATAAPPDTRETALAVGEYARHVVELVTAAK